MLRELESSGGSTAAGGVTTTGSLSHHHLKDSKFCSESFSPQKSGFSSKEQALVHSKVGVHHGSQRVLGPSGGVRMSSNSNGRPQQTNSHRKPSTTGQNSCSDQGLQLLKNNRSDPNMRTLLNKAPISSGKKSTGSTTQISNMAAVSQKSSVVATAAKESAK